MFWVWVEPSGSMRPPVAIRAKPSKQWLPLQSLGLELEAEVGDLLDGAGGAQ